ncbi:MAG: carbohydrate ABC transporter permease [Roseburia sp.]|nr:carbohydrate ABC transporter permease [Ruminococcus sp.]MCM1154849.1 carbohydrate ABC transporter permease [Roseburia sp.]MCM1242468.1 carbohydrate ABC transporter permease [Roseburia sp.]
MRKRIQSIKNDITTVLLLLPAVFVCLPIILLITGSVMGNGELRQYLSPVFADSLDFISWKLVPDYPTFENYGKLLFLTPQFFVLFWNSIKMVGCILAGQLIIGVPAAWAFAVYKVKGSRVLFVLYVVLMLLPFQVTMLSSYLVLNRLGLLNTYQAVVLPAVFSTFPVFLSYGGFRAIPMQLFEAARIDGAGEFMIFRKIGLPLGKSGLLSAMVLGFLEYWNMMEQPMAFLEEKALWPLSLYLPEITWAQAGYAFGASIITLIPAVFIFVWGQDYLEQGIIFSGLKE